MTPPVTLSTTQCKNLRTFCTFMNEVDDIHSIVFFCRFFSRSTTTLKLVAVEELQKLKQDMEAFNNFQSLAVVQNFGGLAQATPFSWTHGLDGPACDSAISIF